MFRRWSLPLTAAALIAGSVLASGSASAATSWHPVLAPHVTPGGPMIRTAGPGTTPQAHGLRHQTESTNWSGYAVTGRNGAFSSVSASWVEPTGTCTSRHSAQYSSFWVGLDGFNSNSVEQTGTDVDCSGRTAVYYGWFEMFPAAPVNYKDTVRPGDHFSASVTFSGTSTYTLVLTDSTQGWTHTTTKSQTGLARSSAEVITEAPSSVSGVLPLADFGTVNYSVSKANGTSLGTQHPTEIIMVDNAGRDKDTTSPISSVGAFSNTWLRSR
jgi:Peptidase A4 family